MAQVQVILPARNEGPLLAATLRSLALTRAGVDFDVVVVDDGSQPPADCGAGPRPDLIRTAGEGAAAARNRGATAGGAPVLCFCDAHLEFTPDWLVRLVDALGEFDAVCPGIAAAGRPRACGFGFTWGPRCEVRWLPRPVGRAEVPLLPGGCLCVRRSVFGDVGGFDAGLAPWGYEDAEFSWSLWQMGFRCGVEPNVSVAHHFRARHPYFIRQAEVDRNLLRLGCVHFGPARLARLVARLGVGADVVAGVAARAQARRRWLHVRRRHDDDWVCARFGLPI